MAQRTFKHSGDLGDVLFALPTIRALGGGVLYLDPNGGQDEPIIRRHLKRGRTRLNAKSIESLGPILCQQPYIEEVRVWGGEPVDCNLDAFRDYHTRENLADAHLAAFGLPFEQRDTAWLSVADPIELPQYPIIISRTVRCTPHHSWWFDMLPDILGRCAFVGFAEEHQIFQYAMEREVPYVQTPDLLTVARVIAGCKHFIGNQSAIHAMAEAMKKPLICEICRVAPAVRFERPGAAYV